MPLYLSFAETIVQRKHNQSINCISYIRYSFNLGVFVIEIVLKSYIGIVYMNKDILLNLGFSYKIVPCFTRHYYSKNKLIG